MAATPKHFEKRYLSQALKYFATFTGSTTSAQHIKPLHYAIACRLVIEGGFDPEWITPRPPFKAIQKGKSNVWRLELAEDKATGSEKTILGGLKTKTVDVVVTSPDLGPVLAISCKGATKAFRNLTNRLEETIGECTNLHITYPALVMGYYMLIRGNRTVKQAKDAPQDPELEIESEGNKSDYKKDDLAFNEGTDTVVDSITRFHDALARMTNRRDLRDEISRYEAMAMTIVEVSEPAGRIYPAFPSAESPLHPNGFFKTLYRRYDERFFLGAASIAHLRRKVWTDNDVIQNFQEDAAFWGGYLPRLVDTIQRD